MVIRGRQGSACERGEDSDLVTRWAGGRTQVALNFAGSGITLVLTCVACVQGLVAAPHIGAGAGVKTSSEVCKGLGCE